LIFDITIGETEKFNGCCKVGCTLDSALLNDLLESFVTLENTFCFGFSEDFWRTLYGKKLLV